MTSCFFASDLHGHTDRYQKLFTAIEQEPRQLVFLGGDLLPPFIESLHREDSTGSDFVNGFLKDGFSELKRKLNDQYPSVFLILGNDDPKTEEESLEQAGKNGLWTHIHGRVLSFGQYTIAGYACVPPTPFKLKDWERYDVSRFVDPGCIPPEEGSFSVPTPTREISRQTIQNDLEKLTNGMDFSNAVFLFHSPPYDTVLDRAALDGRMVDHAPLDVHVGSIAIKRFLERTQPIVSMHGHVHESAELTGSWKGQIGRTHILGAAHSGPELALVGFTLENPGDATRELL
ncbi:MAG TPA: metallophosphoesterase [Bacteroidota bacterium]|nr:metallophosphoesterase [Bacteroidota bacterium]